jgi:hypothetical protein
MGHTLGVTTTPSSAPNYPPAKPPTSVGQVFALVAGFLALAAIGAAIGWAVTDTSGPAPVAAVTTTPSPTPTATQSVTQTPTGNAGSFAVPNFHAAGTDFITARATLRAKSLGVLLVFNASAGGNGVVSYTSPAAGTFVNKGITVKIYVNEAAPVLGVPNVVNKTCAEAKTALVDAGFVPKYASGKVGIVMAQAPDSTANNAHWNDTVALQCAIPPVTPSTPPSLAPSDPPAPSASPA